MRAPGVAVTKHRHTGHKLLESGRDTCSDLYFSCSYPCRTEVERETNFFSQKNIHIFKETTHAKYQQANM